MDAAADHFTAAAGEFHAAEARAAATAATTSSLELIQTLNKRAGAVERYFLLRDGLPGRRYFRHCLQAPGLYTGYAPKTLPGVYDAVSALDWATANAQASLAAERIEAAARALRGVGAAGGGGLGGSEGGGRRRWSVGGGET